MESEFYLELIAKELSGEISEIEKSLLYEWTHKVKNRGLLLSPLLRLYLNMGNKKMVVQPVKRR